jgi:regulator of cell morphogenesis and NO signaling
MNELVNKTLAQIVTTDHRAASVFEKYQLDFCCKGKRSLQQACEEISVPVDTLLGELAQASVSSKLNIEFDKMSLAQLADFIVLTHHDFVKREMPQILFYLEKVAAKHGLRHPEMLNVFNIFENVKKEMDQHMANEEEVLFPQLKRLEAGDINAIRPESFTSFEQEHEHAGAFMQEIRQLTNNYTPPAGACTTFRLSFAALQAFEADLHQHVHLENNILFPKAVELSLKLAGYMLN